MTAKNNVVFLGIIAPFLFNKILFRDVSKPYLFGVIQGNYLQFGWAKN